MRWNFLNGYSGILPYVKGAVYIYFGTVMDNGATLLTQGSLDDLRKLGLVPQDGMRLTFYDYDADAENRPTYLCADGTLRHDAITGQWGALIDESTFRAVPRPQG